MRLSIGRLPWSLVLATLARAADTCTFDPGNGGDVFELPAGVHSATRKVEWPPTTLHETVQFNLCSPLAKDDQVAAEDQCPDGTRACFTRVHVKGDSKMVVAVIPSGLDAQKNTASSLQNGGGVDITIPGGVYVKQQQSFVLTAKCAKESSDPEFKNYEHGVVSVEWAIPNACPKKRTDGDGEAPPPPVHESSGGSLRMFFLLFLVAIVGYFAIGSYYNYNTYGASGWDVIPHKDFWREAPFLVQDLASHLCSAFQPRSRGGYVSV